MIREILKTVDYSSLAMIALVLFVLVFVAVTIKTFFTSHQVTDQQAGIPLSDGKRVQR
ncbi:MAG: hypothetical protein ABJZ55_22870 [Fuerstiella sp.]